MGSGFAYEIIKKVIDFKARIKLALKIDSRNVDEHIKAQVLFKSARHKAQICRR